MCKTKHFLIICAFMSILVAGQETSEEKYGVKGLFIFFLLFFSVNSIFIFRQRVLP